MIAIDFYIECLKVTLCLFEISFHTLMSAKRAEGYSFEGSAMS